MNRHFQNYSAMSCEPLGAPIRKQAAKPSPETQWKPVPGHPDYRERINAQGVREVSHKDHVPAPSPQAEPAAPVITPLAPPQPAAPTEWQSGPPPERGWREVKRADHIDMGRCVAYWNGVRYTGFTVRSSAREFFSNLVSMYPDPESKATWVKPSGELRALWRGPRLTGEAWPEPQQ